MFKRLSQLFIAILMTLPVAAAQSSTVIGYCDGKLANTSTIGSNNGNGLIEAAAIFPASIFDKYEDLEILGINAGITSRLNISEISVWVRETLEGSNIFEASLSKENGITKGWNRVMGDATLLPKGKDLYIGYTLSLTGASYPVSAVGESCKGGLLVNTDGTWIDMSEDGLGVLSIEMIATASNLTSYDLVLRQVTMPETIKIGSTVPLGLKIFNAGAERVTGFSIECSVDGYDNIVYDIDQVIEPNEYADIEVDFISQVNVKSQDVSMRVCITDIKDGDDADMSNNEMSVTFSANRLDFKKALLLEEFSTERCTFCPRAAAVVHDLLSEPEYENQILVAVHHVGYNTDWLTIPASNNYLWFYDGGKGNTYAPAFMYDRYSFDNTSPVNNGTSEYSSIKDNVSARLGTAPMSAVEASASYDNETSTMNIHVECERIHTYTGNRLTIYIVENNIEAKSQAGATGPFTHQHVLRGVNEIWGQVIEWDDQDGFSYDCPIYINPAWIKENIEIIAFISQYNPNNYKDCTVDNAVKAEINWNMGSVDEISQDSTDGKAEYYTITGLKVSKPTKGIYVVKRGSRVTKEVIR